MTDDDIETLVTARRDLRGIAHFPGTPPRTLDTAYAAQMRANAAWGDTLAGWKVGRINPPLDGIHGADRFIGAVFADGIIDATDGGIARFPVVRGGFGAFEAELVMEIAADADPDRCDWTADTARTLVAMVHLGVEVAGSPIADIQACGPIASVAAFGNNMGMILGPQIPAWREIDIDAITCTTWIDGNAVASRMASSLPGGPFAALAFALNTTAKLGRPLRAGRYVLTGAITGVHPVRSGQSCAASFADHGRIDCVAVHAGGATIGDRADGDERM